MPRQPPRESSSLLTCKSWLADLLSWEARTLLESVEPERALFPTLPPPLTDTYLRPADYLRLLSAHQLLEIAASLASDARSNSAAPLHGVVQHAAAADEHAADIFVSLEVKPEPGVIGAEDALVVERVAEAWESGSGGSCLALALAEASGAGLWLRVRRRRPEACPVGTRVVVRRLGTLLPALRMQAALIGHLSAPRWLLGCRVAKAPSSATSAFEAAMEAAAARKAGQSPLARAPSGKAAAPLQLPSGLDAVLSAPGPHGCNAVQREAVRALAAPRQGFALLQGPPGTGKTKVVLSLLSALFATRRRPQKVAMPGSGAGGGRTRVRLLVCAPSNCAVDEIVARVLRLGLVDTDGKVWQPTIVRLGPRDSVSEGSAACHLETKMQARAAQEARSARSGGRDDGRVAVLREADIVCCTLVGAGVDSLSALADGAGEGAGKIFDAVVVDEATQSCEAALLVALQHVHSLAILVGDHKQLPPTTKSMLAEKGGLSVSLFERLLACGHAVHRLTTQYRMHPAIAELPSRLFYESALVTAQSAASGQAPPSFPWPSAATPAAFLDVRSREARDGQSHSNVGEVEAVVAVVDRLRAGGVSLESVGVITFYAGQSRLLRRRLPRSVECNTVDAFQGREKDIVILSCVRANEGCRCGFLSDARRANVSLTRARHGLIVVGHAQTLQADQTWGEYLRWARGRSLVLDDWQTALKAEGNAKRREGGGKVERRDGAKKRRGDKQKKAAKENGPHSASGQQ